MFKSKCEEAITEMSAREALRISSTLLIVYLAINSEGSVERAGIFSLKWHLLVGEFGKMRGLGCTLAAV